MANFKDEVIGRFNADRGESVAFILASDITVPLQESGLDDTVSDYTSEQASNITAVSKTTVINNKATYGVAKYNSNALLSYFESGGHATIKNFGANSIDKGALIIKDGSAFYIASHTNFDKFMGTLEVKVAQKTATDKGYTVEASALGTTYNTLKGSW